MSTDITMGKRRVMEQSFEAISPFELKNKLLDLAKGWDQKSTRVLLDAGRGNPNWIATTPRQSFFTLGQFALEESRRVWSDRHLGGKPHLQGIARRLRAYVEHQGDDEGARLLGDIVTYGTDRCGFDPDAWVHELVDGIIGDNYPTPDRMLVHAERIVHDYLMQELCQGERVVGGATRQPVRHAASHVSGQFVAGLDSESAAGRFQLFAVEGATAAMCYIFDTLQANYLLGHGDKVAIMVPIFPPYVEIPQLNRYAFDVVEIRAEGVDADGRHTWQYPDEELDKLRDKSIRALFLVNPSNPPSVAMRPESVRKLTQIVRRDNPDLMVITDDVYSTFVDGFRSLMADLPYNTIGVYSFSKYFGVTGWRLGVVAVHEDNVFDHLLARLPVGQQEPLQKRYSSLTHELDQLKFIDRIVADSRQVALNHTAGLSTPQQVQMTLFAAFALLDKEDDYKHQTQDICRRRMKLLYKGLELPPPQLSYCADYYTEFDLADWSKRHYGSEFTKYLQDEYEPVDILFRLAETSSIVLLNGGGFYGPTWSIRVSLANLDDEAYTRIGHELHQALDGYVAAWRADAQGRR